MNGIGGQRELLAQIETRRKLADRLLALRNLRRRSRMQQPSGERVLSGCAGGLRDQLIEAAVAEDVEIARVEMFGIEKALARVALSGPLVVQPREAAAIEAFKARGCGERAQKALVRDPQDDERKRRNECPGEEAGICTSQPESGHDGDRGRREFAEAEESVVPAQAQPLGFERGQALAVDAFRV